MHVRPITVLALGLLSAAVAGAQVTLVRDGQPAAVVVLPAQPTMVATYAASELIGHVERASGAKLPQVSEAADADDQRARVYIGPCRAASAADWSRLPHSTAIVRTAVNALFLGGRDAPGAPLADATSAGTLFAVYELLERHLGVRWLWPGELGTMVPRQATITIPDTRWQVSPRFVHTRVRFGGLSITPAGFSSLAARGRFADEQMQWLRRHRFNRGTSLEYGHGFEDYWARFHPTHPEYFNRLPDGTRRSDPSYHGGEGRLIAMCVSQPGLARERAAEWARTRTADRPWVNCAENDTCGKCTCEQCLAWDVPGTITDHPDLTPAEGLHRATTAFRAGEPDWWRWLGSVSDRYARFWLATQAEARRTDPEATVLAYAYANYCQPPRRTKLNDHVIVAIVPSLMYPWTAAKRAAFRQQWQGWADTGARLYLRPNYTLDGHAFPIFYAHHLADDFGFAAQRGLLATDFDSLTCQFGAQGPNLYALARLHEHPELGFAAIMAEYCAAFGPAAEAVRAYFAHWQQVSDQVTDQSLAAAARGAGAEGGSWSRFYVIAGDIFTPAVMATGQALLAQARQAAAGDAVAGQRVAFLAKGLRHAELCLAVEAARRAYLKSGVLPEYQAALKQLDDYRLSLEGESVIGPGLLRYLEAPVWDRSLLSFLKQPGEPLAGPWKFRFDPERVGERQAWQAETCDDRDWAPIGTNGPWEQQEVGRQWAREHGRDYDGLGWYRTRFSLQPPRPGERISLVFGAVDEACVIWLNGQRVLERVYAAAVNPNSWAEAFEVDVTRFARHDAPNLLAVRVEDNAGAGGIWRPVWLVQSEPVAETGNAIPDGGFETEPSPWKQHVVAGDCRFSRDAEAAHGGRVSGRIECVKAADREPSPRAGTVWARWYQTGLKVDPARRYRFRAWVMTSRDGQGHAAIWLRSAEGGDGPGNFSLRVPPTHGLWQQVECPDFRPGGPQAAIYLNLMGGVGSVWFDDVELRPIDGQ